MLYKVIMKGILMSINLSSNMQKISQSYSRYGCVLGIGQENRNVMISQYTISHKRVNYSYSETFIVNNRNICEIFFHPSYCKC